MDGLTHAMTGVVLGAAAASGKKSVYPLALVGTAASLLPDADAPVLFALDLFRVGGHAEGYFFYEYHRLFTHNLFLAPALAALVMAVAWAWPRLRSPKTCALALAAILVHYLMDWPCHWRQQLLLPFFNFDFSMGWPLFKLPVMDTSIPLLALSTILGLVLLYLRSNQEEKPPPP